MANAVLLATASFGLESLVRSELRALGCREPRTEDRRVLFSGTADDIARCNIRLRTADRILILLSEFKAESFDDLYEGVRGIRWGDFMPGNPAVLVRARSVKSRLAATPAIQSVGKKAIMDAIARRSGRSRSGRSRIEETGPRYEVEIVLTRDQASVCLDTTGPGLHKRGYRKESGPAPLRENLAAALVLLSRWDSSRPFADPLCGSGTIAIEAALIARNAAPGIARGFAAESWPHVPARAWVKAREEAQSEEQRVPVLIAASDRDGGILEAARRNASNAGVADMIRFTRAPLESFTPAGEHGCLVCNPPYAERLGGRPEVENLYRGMGRLFLALRTWSFFVLTAHPAFQDLFGCPATRNRKLYNGNLRCFYYQYLRDRPRLKAD